jgi:hypothetical protein
MKKLLIIFVLGLLEQFGYTLYLLAVSRYLILVSSLLMFSYLFVYLSLINKIAKDSKDSIKLIIVYSLASALGNFCAMSLKIIK